MVKMAWERGGARARWEDEKGHMHVERVVSPFVDLVRHLSVAHGWGAPQKVKILWRTVAGAPQKVKIL